MCLRLYDRKINEDLSSVKHQHERLELRLNGMDFTSTQEEEAWLRSEIVKALRTIERDVEFIEETLLATNEGYHQEMSELKEETARQQRRYIIQVMDEVLELREKTARSLNTCPPDLPRQISVSFALDSTDSET